MPSDQATRDRFVRELDRNFSVIAPAGVGKTKAIVDRVIEIATGGAAGTDSWLPQLVVVTYTRKAALEMHQRARNEIVRRAVGPMVMSSFNRAFFGTIHSFCLNLLRTHGHFLGLPATVDIAEDEDALWIEYIRQQAELGRSVAPEVRRCVFRLLPLQQVIRLGRSAQPEGTGTEPLPPCPPTDIRAVMNFRPDKRSEGTVGQAQEMLRDWHRRFSTSEEFAPLPSFGKGGAAFQEVWQRTLRPVRTWLRGACWAIARDLASGFRDYREGQGQLTYDDQIRLVADLLQHPEAGRQLRAQAYRIILDEAQDTDPTQFRILLELSRPPAAGGSWLKDGGPPPRPGHFCMVGDPQQSIYSNRADLAEYQRIRQKLTADNAAEELTFEVTFRCDTAIVNKVNQVGPHMLHGQSGQAEFVPLRTRPAPGPGQVIRWTPALPPGVDPDSGVNQLSRAEADQLAAWLTSTGLENLRAPDWSEVAILCPRVKWLKTMESALREAGLASQLHSPQDVQGDSPVYAWTAALLTVLTEPEDGFELVGVLREVFGISDQLLSDFGGGDGGRFQIATATGGEDPVATILNQLHALRLEVTSAPLFEAVSRVVEATELAARVAAIGHDPNLVAEDMQGLIMRAAEAEAEQVSLREWARVLVDEYENTVEEKPVVENAIQLLTCHKAKGLQWHAVILPFLGRAIVTRGPGYPFSIPTGAGRPPHVALDGSDMEDLAPIIKRRQFHELQRLLYVAMTRARHTLVLSDDGHVFGNEPVSFAACLGLKPRQDSSFLEGLPTSATPAPPEAATAEVEAPPFAPVPPVHSQEREQARARAQVFAIRTLPYMLAEHRLQEEREAFIDGDPAEDPDARGAAARDYGTWWHRMMETMPWSESREAWQRHAASLLRECPDPSRGEAEWKKFIESPLADRLGRRGTRVRTEIPFLWKRSERECVEGFMDLAAQEAEAREWLVVDWKTNRVDSRGAPDLWSQYEPQLKAYADALTGITGQATRPTLYSTASGVWMGSDGVME